MSFLNPVNEPVLRFSSTDASAPQINYNARTAGDVKTVLKACLVTGYGAKASAGWSILDVAENICRFTSNATAMLDSALHINDSDASRTYWYHYVLEQYVTPVHNSASKSFDGADLSDARNGWQLLVTARGFYFIETLKTVVQGLQSRITYWGAVKMATNRQTAPTNGLSYWQVGYGSSVPSLGTFFSSSDTINKDYSLVDTGVAFTAANIAQLSINKSSFGGSVVDLVAELYLHKNGKTIGQHAGVLLKDVNDSSRLQGIESISIDGRPALAVSMSGYANTIDAGNKSARIVLLYLDYWEY